MYPLPLSDKNTFVISPIVVSAELGKPITLGDVVVLSWTISLPWYASPEQVSSSKIILASVPSGGAIVPFWSTILPWTTLTKPAAFAPNVPVLSKLILSPIA